MHNLDTHRSCCAIVGVGSPVTAAYGKVVHGTGCHFAGARVLHSYARLLRFAGIPVVASILTTDWIFNVWAAGYTAQAFVGNVDTITPGLAGIAVGMSIRTANRSVHIRALRSRMDYLLLRFNTPDAGARRQHKNQ